MRLSVLVLFAVASVITGCPPDRCTTGLSIACACPDGRTGAQVCLADGTFGVCSCASDAGTDAGETDTGSTDVPVDVGPIDVGSPDAGPPPCVRDIDLLFQVDTSRSMVQEQAILNMELPRLVRVLATGDRDGDGTPDFTPAESLHLGVITPDMGSGPISDVSGCDPGFGDDGILRNAPGTVAGSCLPSYPSGVFAFRAGIDDATVVATNSACVANAGTGGCGFEQQLEAALKSLSPASVRPWVRSDYVAPAFSGGAMPHGDGMNNGFLRAGSLLAVTIVTDEDDCSTTNYDLFNPSSATFTADLNLRCSTHASTLHPISRYRDGLLQLRSDPRLLVFTALAGTPLDAAFGDSVAGYTMLLDHAEMAIRLNMDGNNLLPACSNGTTGDAYPARRLVETASALNAAGARTHVGSICQGSYSADINAIIDAIAAGAPSCM